MAEEILKDNVKDGEFDSEREMTFLEHLEELRWRLIYSIIGVIVGSIIAWIFIDFLVDVVLLKPAKDSGALLQNLKPFGQLFLYMQIAIMVGIIISIPNIFFQLWQFISPALHKHERRYILFIVIFSSICFLGGIAFAYFVMLPLTLQFAAQFGSASIKNEFAIDEYMSIITSVMLAAGLIFELPMLSFFLSKLGILKPSFMKKYRRHSIVVIMILAAFLTPGAVPLVLLYEVSILVSKFSQKKS